MTIALVVCVEAAAYGLGKTDVVILANGDRIASLGQSKLDLALDHGSRNHQTSARRRSTPG